MATLCALLLFLASPALSEERSEYDGEDESYSPFPGTEGMFPDGMDESSLDGLFGGIGGMPGGGGYYEDYYGGGGGGSGGDPPVTELVDAVELEAWLASGVGGGVLGLFNAPAFHEDDATGLPTEAEDSLGTFLELSRQMRGYRFAYSTSAPLLADHKVLSHAAWKVYVHAPPFYHHEALEGKARRRFPGGGLLNPNALHHYVLAQSTPLVGELAAENEAQYAERPTVVVLSAVDRGHDPSRARYLANRLRTVAEELREEGGGGRAGLAFALRGPDAEAAHDFRPELFGAGEDDVADAKRVVVGLRAPDDSSWDGARFFRMEQDGAKVFSADAVRAFVASWRAGELAAVEPPSAPERGEL